LRDVHTIQWLVKAVTLHHTPQGISLLLNRAEIQKLLHAFYFLAGLRIHLHMLAKREENRLLFEMQLLLCKALGIDLSNANQASERLMHRYF